METIFGRSQPPGPSHLRPSEPGALPDRQGIELVTSTMGAGARRIQLKDILPPWQAQWEG